jgi:hypothetical protein
VVGGGGHPLGAVAPAGMMYCPLVELPSVEEEARRILQKRPSTSRSWRRVVSERSKRFRRPCAERIRDETPKILVTGMVMRRRCRGE